MQPQFPYRDGVLAAAMSPGTSNFFLALSQVSPFLTGSPSLSCLLAPDGGSCTSLCKSQGPFSPFPFPGTNLAVGCVPKNTGPAELLAARAAGQEAGLHLITTPTPENTEPFTAAQGQAFSPRDNQEFTGTRFALVMD